MAQKRAGELSPTHCGLLERASVKDFEIEVAQVAAGLLVLLF